MDKLKKYQKAIKTVIEKNKGGLTPKYDEYSDIVSFDDERGHYFLMGVGWKDSKRVQDITIHIDIKDKKVWIQSDWTDTDVTQQLESLGVAQEDIVLAFIEPCRRADMAVYPVS